MNEIESALNPDLTLGAIRSRERPLSPREYLERMHAFCAALPNPTRPSCTGNIFVGLFFDGTGNNEKADYQEHENDVRHQRHSNVARLYHAFPAVPKEATTGYSRYYIPGVGTPFEEIGDKGGKMGSATAWGGEPRIIWGLTRLFNAVHAYHFGRDLISNDQAKAMTEDLGGIGSVGAQRRHALKVYWSDKLRSAIKGFKPEVTLINLSVFGFSRGAAEARAFVNWLFEICEHEDGAYLFAGIPLRVQFLGLFDTVASVGLAGLYSFAEGRQSWADDNMQVHPAVQRCLHLVAGHEVRACFPLDSVRIDGTYPPNAREYVYPGSHSDLGGGYMPLALGKANWRAQSPDDQIARIPGFEMYCAALAAGVPLTTFGELKKSVADALMPSTRAHAALRQYHRHAAIQPAPVEDMLRQHMSLYLKYRWKGGESQFKASPQFKRALSKPNADQGQNYADEPRWLVHTQRALASVVGALVLEIERRIASNEGSREREGHHLNNPCAEVDSKAPLLVRLAGTVINAKSYWDGRKRLLADDGLAASTDIEARKAITHLKSWRQWLATNGFPEIHRTDAPEREAMWLLDAIAGPPVPEEIQRFFDELVHDSMAGFIGFGMPEFEYNGYGLAKFRRIYFGDRGDAIVKERVEAENERRRTAARAIRNEISARMAPPTIPSTGVFPQGF